MADDKKFQLKNILAALVPSLTALLMELLVNNGKLSRATNIDRLKDGLKALYHELDRIDPTPDEQLPF